MFSNLYRSIIGKPVSSDEMGEAEIPKWKALPIFSSDALSSVGYGPEQIAIILAISSMYAYFYYVVLAILILLAIVAISYSQVIKAHPGGGGSYSVAKEYLGEAPALTAGAALLADYILTVAVSVSSGTAALVSAFPILSEYNLWIDGFILICFLTVINLKGVREASTIFVWPTYAFILAMFFLIANGLYGLFTGSLVPENTGFSEPPIAISSITLFILLHAFANGCSSMTGVEAIANGTTIFKKPKATNAIKATIYMALLLGGMLIGLSHLIITFHLVPQEGVTLLSVLAENIFGRNIVYYFIQIATMLILYLAANTAYNGLPPLLSIISADGYMPRYLQHRGDRLGYDNGIIFLSFSAGLLIYIFQGNVEHLISLYALGVFLSFTIAQSAMVVHWFRERKRGWIFPALLNGFGAIITFVVILIIAITKFSHGVWIVMVFIPCMIIVFRKIHAHYANVKEQLLLTREEYRIIKEKPLGQNHIVIPIDSTTTAVAKSIRYAKSISSAPIQALHIGVDEVRAEKVAAMWRELEPDIEIHVIHSPYRQIMFPLLRYIRKLRRHISPLDTITVIIPEFETKKFWQKLLHNQTGWIMTMRLLREDRVVVTTVPLQFKK